MPTGGWISKHAFQDNALAADADGRAAMEDGYLIGAKIASSTITVDKIDPNILSYFLPFLEIDIGAIDYSLIQ